MEETLYVPQRPADAEIGTWDFDWREASISKQMIVKCPKCSHRVSLDVKFHCVGCGYHHRFPDLAHGMVHNWPPEEMELWAQVKCVISN
jgi:hypothetical protein